MRSRGRISRLIKKFGKETEIYRKLPNDKKDPYNRGKFELEHTIQAIIDENTQGGKSRYSQDRVIDMVDAVLYCEVVEIRTGDKVVQRDKEYRVTKASNPYNADDHIECLLELWN